MHSMYLAGVPLPWSMLRQPIHFAPGAIPIWLPAPSSPIAVPVVWDRGRNHRKGLANQDRKRHRRNEWSRASYNCDWR